MPHLSEVAGNDLREKLENLFAEKDCTSCILHIRFWEKENPFSGYDVEIILSWQPGIVDGGVEMRIIGYYDDIETSERDRLVAAGIDLPDDNEGFEHVYEAFQSAADEIGDWVDAVAGLGNGCVDSMNCGDMMSDKDLYYLSR